MILSRIYHGRVSDAVLYLNWLAIQKHQSWRKSASLILKKTFNFNVLCFSNALAAQNPPVNIDVLQSKKAHFIEATTRQKPVVLITHVCCKQ